MLRGIKVLLALQELLLLNSESLLQHQGALTSDMVLELLCFKLIELNGSLLYDLSLLSNTEAFEVIEADAHLLIDVRGEPPGRLHVDLGGLMVPEPLMILLFHGQAPHVPLLVNRLIFSSPTWSPKLLLNEVDGLGEHPPVAHVAVHGDLVLASHLREVGILCQLLQVGELALLGRNGHFCACPLVD